MLLWLKTRFTQLCLKILSFFFQNKELREVVKRIQKKLLTHFYAFYVVVQVSNNNCLIYYWIYSNNINLKIKKN